MLVRSIKPEGRKWKNKVELWPSNVSKKLDRIGAIVHRASEPSVSANDKPIQCVFLGDTFIKLEGKKRGGGGGVRGGIELILSGRRDRKGKS